MRALLRNTCPECGSLEIAYDGVHGMKYCMKCGVVMEDMSFAFE